MNRIFVLTVMILLILQTSYSSVQGEENDSFKKQLNGKIKSFREILTINLTANNGKNKKNIYHPQTIYNEKGLIIETVCYNNDGSFRFKSVNKYDYNGNKIEYVFFKADGSSSDKTIFKYNEKGKCIEEYNYNSTGSLNSKSTHKYNDRGECIETNIYKTDGSLEKKLIFKFDEKGNRIEYNFYNGNIYDGKVTLKYDSKGNCLEQCNYSPDGSLNQKMIWKYDVKGKLIEENNSISLKNSDDLELEEVAKIYKNGLTNDKTTFVYNEKGNLIEEKQYNSDGSVASKANYKYDYMGNLIEEKWFVYSEGKISDKSTVHYKYNYDTQKNWIKKIQYGDQNIPEVITERIIEYYE